jgi:hypothetical protein
MNFKRWRIGLVVAIVTGVCTAFTVGLIVPGMTLKEGALIMASTVAKDILLFLKDHPHESIEGVVGIKIEKL